MNLIEVIFGDGRWLYLWHGLEVTLVLTVLSLILGLIIGLVVALMRLSHIAPLRWIGKAYVTIIRGTPLLVQLLIMYYVVFGSYQFMPKLIVAAIALASIVEHTSRKLSERGWRVSTRDRWRRRAPWG